MTERKCLNLIKKDWEIMSSNPDLMEKAKSQYLTNKVKKNMKQIYETRNK